MDDDLSTAESGDPLEAELECVRQDGGLAEAEMEASEVDRPR